MAAAFLRPGCIAGSGQLDDPYLALVQRHGDTTEPWIRGSLPGREVERFAAVGLNQLTIGSREGRKGRQKRKNASKRNRVRP
jgi:hypothetical protein